MSMENTHIHKSHNVIYILYHFVCPIKNRKKVLNWDKRKNDLRDICEEIESSYEIYFLEIWSDLDHVHFLVQSVPTESPKSIISTIKSITWRGMFKRNSELRWELQRWKFWTSWYYVNTVWRYGSESMIRNYVKNQWIEKTYEQIHKSQLKLNLC